MTLHTENEITKLEIEDAVKIKDAFIETMNLLIKEKSYSVDLQNQKKVEFLTKHLNNLTNCLNRGWII